MHKHSMHEKDRSWRMLSWHPDMIQVSSDPISAYDCSVLGCSVEHSAWGFSLVRSLRYSGGESIRSGGFATCSTSIRKPPLITLSYSLAFLLSLRFTKGVGDRQGQKDTNNSPSGVASALLTRGLARKVRQPLYASRLFWCWLLDAQITSDFKSNP